MTKLLYSRENHFTMILPTVVLSSSEMSKLLSRFEQISYAQHFFRRANFRHTAIAKRQEPLQAVPLVKYYLLTDDHYYFYSKTLRIIS